MTVYAVIFVPVPSQDLGLQRHVMVFFFYVQWVGGYCSFGEIVDHHYLNKNVDITTRFWNNLHQVRSKPND